MPEDLAPWELALLSSPHEPYIDPTPIYTETRRAQREQFFARLGFTPTHTTEGSHND